MLLSLVYINCDYLQAQTTIPRFEEGERVVFVGNSITHGGHYHSFIWLYYMTRFPDKPITIMMAGIGGESAWDMKVAWTMMFSTGNNLCDSNFRYE